INSKRVKNCCKSHGTCIHKCRRSGKRDSHGGLVNEKNCNYKERDTSDQAADCLDLSVTIGVVNIAWFEGERYSNYQYRCDYSVQQGVGAICYEGKAVCENACYKFKDKDRRDGDERQ